MIKMRMIKLKLKFLIGCFLKIQEHWPL